MKRKWLVSMPIVLMLFCTCASSALVGGTNTELPSALMTLPQTINREYDHIEPITVAFKTLPDGSQLSMNIYLPPVSAVQGDKSPCIVMTRGSGLRAVELSSLANYAGQLEMFAQQGYVVVGIEFRGYTTEPMEMGKFPAALQDCRAAIRFLKATAETYGIDPDRIGVIGQSSGGYEASMLGITNGAWGVDVGDDTDGTLLGTLYFTEADADAAAVDGKNVLKLDTAEGDVIENAKDFDSKVVSVIDLYGLSKLDEIGADVPHTLEAGTSQEEVKFMTADTVTEIGDCPYVQTGANPYWYIDQQDVDELTMLFLHGTADLRVPPLSTERFYELAQEAGIKSYRYLIPDGDHGGKRFMDDDTSTMYLDFFSETLKGATGNRVIVINGEGGIIEVSVNGTVVDSDNYQLSNLTAEDKLTVKATAAEGFTFDGFVLTKVDDAYTTSQTTVYTADYSLIGNACYSVNAIWTPEVVQ